MNMLLNRIKLLSATLLAGAALVGCPQSLVTSQFAATQRLYEAPLTTQFSIATAPAAKIGQPETILSYLWDFGDGTQSTAVSPVHEYTAPGLYTVTLTTTGTKGTVSTTTLPNYINVLESVRTEGVNAGDEMTFSGIEFVWVPAGSFAMGDASEDAPVNWPDATPAHEVIITRGFWMSKYEITQEQFFAVTGVNDSMFRIPGIPNSMLPADSVSWFDAQDFITQLNESSEEGLFRLPTEAEWEYACRAGTTTTFSFGDDATGVELYANTNQQAPNSTIEVGQLLPNPWGLFDMHGNVFEWVQDRYVADAYPSSAATDPFGPDVSTFNVARGGAWYNQPFAAASPARFGFLRVAKYNFIGLRVIMQ